ncbi:hypothetical protein GQ457_02G037850 [Hibiscus cannabinus]
METPSGLMVSLYTTFYFKTEFFKNGLAKFCTSPIETILCLDNKQSMYCQLLTSLLGRDEVVRIGSIFASVLARSFKFLEDYWKELCSNIRTGYLSDWIIDPGCKNAISSILTGPNPELADLIEQISTGSCEITNETRTVNEPVDLANVKLGQYYEVVVTTLTGLYRYRVGDVLKVTGFYNKSPQFQFVERKNVVLSIDLDKTTEEDLSKAITKAELGLMLATYSSYACTSLTPGRYVLFWELKMKDSNGIPTLDAKIMEQCCRIVEESFDFTYKSLRKADVIDDLELRVVKRGTFDELMDFYVSKGASISQYKPPSCVKSEEAMKILNSGMVGKFFSPKTLF